MDVPPKYRGSFEFAFHRTDCDNIESIRTSGIRQDTEPNGSSTDILSALDELGYTDPFPFDRATVTYCHVDAEYVSNCILQTDDERALASNDAVVVVDIGAIDAETYMADMSIITDLVDYKYAGGDAMMHAETPDEVIELYNDSITQVRSPSDIKEYLGTGPTYPELVVDGDIPPSAVVDVLDPHAAIQADSR